MNNNIQTYSQLATKFLQQIAVHNKIESDSINTQKQITDFEKYISQYPNLLTNYKGIDKHIAYFLDNHNFSNVLDYSPMIKSLDELVRLHERLQILLSKVQLINSYYDRYNKNTELQKTKDLVLFCKEKMTLQNVNQKLSEIETQIISIDKIMNSFESEKNQLVQIKNNLLQNNKLWKEQIEYFDSLIVQLLPKYTTENFNINNFISTIKQAETEKENDIQQYEQSISNHLSDYQTWLNDLRNSVVYKNPDFENLKQRIIESERQKRNARIKKIVILVLKILGIAAGAAGVIALVYYYWYILLGIVVVAGLIFYFAKK